jgi:hypothetical protein
VSGRENVNGLCISFWPKHLCIYVLGPEWSRDIRLESLYVDLQLESQNCKMNVHLVVLCTEDSAKIIGRGT